MIRAIRSRRILVFTSVLGLALAGGVAPPAGAQLARRGLDGLEEKPLAHLSVPPTSPLEKTALALAPARWKHAESDHFVYHYFNSYAATPVAVEAEFYYRVVSGDLALPTEPKPAAKVAIFLFEEPGLWREFQGQASLDPWSGGIHSGGSLFLLRDRSMKFKDRTLGHEIVHALLQRHFGKLPLWLDEGYAEYASIIGHASFLRARSFAARPRSDAVEAAHYLPVAELVRQTAYPAGDAAVTAFYAESHRLVSFLQQRGKAEFRVLLEASQNGQSFESALSKSYGGMFNSPGELETAFRPYAVARD